VLLRESVVGERLLDRRLDRRLDEVGSPGHPQRAQPITRMAFSRAATMSSPAWIALSGPATA
jgi:hypothetical protein